MFCTTCGAPLAPNARFCTACGSPVAPAPTAPQPGPAPATTAPAQPVPSAPAAPYPSAPAGPMSAAPVGPYPSTPAAQPAPAAGGSVDALPSYLQAVAARLGVQPRFISETGAYLLVAERFGAFAVKMHSYFFFAANDALGYSGMQAYAQACTTWALNNYEGLPRGMQKGLAIYPVMLQHPLVPDAVAYVKQVPEKHWAAFELPVLLDPQTGQLETLDKTPVWGFAMWSGIKKAARFALTGVQA